MGKIIDVSTYNGFIDWSKVVQDGVTGAIIKCINKNNNPDKSFTGNYMGATFSKLPCGVYDYVYVTSVEENVKRAKRVLEILGDIKPELGVWYDLEDVCQRTISGRQMVNNILAYKSVIEKAGIKFGVYTGLSFYNEYLKKYASELDCDFWIARYPTSTTMKASENPNNKYKPNIPNNLFAWQYSSKTQVNGIKGNCDISIVYNNTPLAINYYPKYTETFETALKSIGETETGYTKRKEIAKLNGIPMYSGTAEENSNLLSLLKKGVLIKG